jgi:hypothetical protein
LDGACPETLHAARTTTNAMQMVSAFISDSGIRVAV